MAGLIDFSAAITAEQKAADARAAKVLRIVAERERRLALGFDYDFGDARGVHRIGTTAEDMVGWDEVTKVANAFVLAGLDTQAMTIVTDTGPAQVTAVEWQSVLIAAGTFRQPIWAASFALQAAPEIPDDLENDVYWPAV